MTFSGNTVSGIQGGVSNIGFVYGQVTSQWISQGFTANSNVCTAATTGNASCIGARYVNDATISGNKTTGYNRLMWWGGDANDSTGNGAASNPRWATNITFTNNFVQNPLGGMGLDG